jgi:hypothetical protein
MMATAGRDDVSFALTPEECQRAAAAMERQAARLRGQAPAAPAQAQAQTMASATFSSAPVHFDFDRAQYLAALERTAEVQRAEIARLQAERALLDPYESTAAWARSENRRTGAGGQQGPATFSQGGSSGDRSVDSVDASPREHELRQAYELAAAYGRQRNEVDRRRGRHAHAGF